MSMLLRRQTWKAGLAVVAGLCIAAGITTAASSGARTQDPPVDHQLCYSAYGPYYRAPTRIILKNQFMPNGFQPKIISTALLHSTAVLHCNPVIKFTQFQTFDVTNPNAHLACYKMKADTQPTHVVLVGNQFGQAYLNTGQPNLFCVPSWKGLTGPPKQQPKTPPGLNHFTCYPVTPHEGVYQPPPIELKDQFSANPVTAQVNPVPVKLCLPTEKFLPATSTDFPIINPDLHLLCYPVVITTKHPSFVYDENQFGTRKVAVRAAKLLCLPSFKYVIQ